MADRIKCPVCGQLNPPDGEFCQNCQSRLQPLTGPLRSENAPIQPGQIPTQRVTAELEPILPQWLRDARKQARKTAEEEAAIKAENAQKTVPVPQADLLAGLNSQSQGPDEDEETPDWLTNITGTPAKKKKLDVDDIRVKWVELGHEDAGPGRAGTGSADENAVPPWMAAEEKPPEKDDLTAWFNSASSTPPAAGLKERADQSPLQGDSTEPADEQAAWNPPNAQPSPHSTDDQADWLKNLDSGTFAPSPAPAAPAQANTLDWLQDQNYPPPLTTSSDAGSSRTELPDWLRSEGPTAAAPSADKTETAPLNAPAAPAVLPDWLASFKGEAAAPTAGANQAAAPVFKEETGPHSVTPSPAFTDESISTGDVDAIFGSMEMPDWLTSAAATGPTPIPESKTKGASSDAGIAPAELPSWVQAMRPVEATMSGAGSTDPADTTLETSGPLAGLQGVLPAIPGVTDPLSKPKSQSIKLNISNEQLTQSALLEKVLSAETAPIPMDSGSILASQRLLRWTLAVLVFVVLGAAVFTRTQIFALPARVPNDETEAAISTTDLIPAGAPVLLVFDYEPSLSGEMQAAAAPLLNRLLLLKHPRLAIVSTSPTGAALAEGLMSGPLAARQYLRGTQYVDLGYLPGGLTGVYDFAQNPLGVIPLSADGIPTAGAVPLQGITHLSDFASIFVLTDSLEAGRVWIEQTGASRGRASMVIVSSAQAGPMLMPYISSGQVNGMVSGLNGAAKVEEANGQPGIARRDWDAYSAGLWLAVIAMVLGGFWNFVLGSRDRRAQESG